MRMRFAVAFFGIIGGTIALSRSGCLCTNDQPCWPSAAIFAQLECQLSQPLVYPLPTASPCYPSSDPSGNCTDASVNWNNGFWRAAQPGSMEMTNWEVFTFPNGTVNACYLNTTIMGVCDQGSVPAIGVDARSVADVQVAIRFAVEHGLKVVIKNTGHDFIGRSTARGAFQVWVHNMQDITYHRAFVPQGAPADETYEAVTLGGGVQWRKAYAAAHEHGRLMVGGISAGSVGTSGGWLAGGGESVLSPAYGLGVDNVLEMSIVLSTGEYLVANVYENSDLFWALRGGGGGTYGIVTSVTYRTYPEVPIQLWSWQANVTNSSVLPVLVEGLLRHQIEHTDAGWGGGSSILARSVRFTYFAANMSNETVVITTEGWRNFTESLTPYGVVSSQVFSTSSWGDLLDDFVEISEKAATGVNLLLATRLLTRESIAQNASQLAEILVRCEGGSSPNGGGRVSQIPPDSVGLHPGWRSAISHTVCGGYWNDEASAEEIQVAIQRLQGLLDAFSDVAPDDPAYLNEAFPYERDWQKTFFGSHYPALKSIKDKYDPYRLFAVREGVGSDDWNKNLTCRY